MNWFRKNVPREYKLRNTKMGNKKVDWRKKCVGIFVFILLGKLFK